MRKAAISCWNLVSPFAAGIGLASAAVSFVIGLYYNTMVAWTLLYLWGSSSAALGSIRSSKKAPLPFSACPAQERDQLRAEVSGQTDNSSIETECQVSRSVPSWC